MLRSLRAACLVILATLPVPPGTAGAEDEPPAGFLPHTPTSWLGCPPVDRRARRPFNPDAVFERYLLDPASPVPHAGDAVTGSAASASWFQVALDAKGRIGGRVTWAYTRVDAPAEQVVMADLRNGATVFVNGTPHVGSIYGDRFEVPVLLREGRNDIYVRGVRGAFGLTLRNPPAPIFMAPWRATVPDLVTGERADTVAGVLIVNATREPVEGVTARFAGNPWLLPSDSAPRIPVAPLSVVQVRFPIHTRPGMSVPTGLKAVEVDVVVWGGEKTEGHTTPLKFPVRGPTQPLIRTFVSQIDDSVQRYGLRRPSGAPGERPMGLVLSLHGAGVGPRGQAAAYAAKPDFWLIAPTNRDRFGFDWQDWGRLDAYEVLQDALRLTGVDRRRVYLSGHSMGGHGTWHLGANDPDGFAAIAPSAGWISFDTYPGPRPEGALKDLWHAADGATKTRALLDNLLQLPTFIVHGTKDDNVPVAQAREMEALLTKGGAAPRVHYEEGKGHWWSKPSEPKRGALCVDWPGIFELFRESVIPEQPDAIRFMSMHPSVDSTHHWIEVLQPRIYGRPTTMEARFDPETRWIDITTKNVRSFRVTHTAPRAGIRVDGSEWASEGAEPVWWTLGGDGTVLEHWRPDPEGPHPQVTVKTPRHGGPFRQAWSNRFVMVYGTAGTPAEDKALLEQARFDAQRWAYRGNGQALLLRDVDYERMEAALGLHARNVILYGNRDTNSLFGVTALGIQAPRVARRSLVFPGVREVGDDLAACFLRPLDTQQTAGVVASTGIAGSRLGFTLMTFVSGAGWPDYAIFSTRVLTKGDEGVLRAGWYGPDWLVHDDGFVPGRAPVPASPVKPK